MNEKNSNIISTFGTSFLGVIFLSWFLFSNPVSDFVELIPGLDNRPESLSGSSEDVNIGAIYASFDGTPSEIQGSWPRFLGADFDNISKEKIELADSWSEAGPDILWSVDLGEGFAGPAVANGKVYVLDYDEVMRADLLRCFSFDDGREIWQRGYNIYIKRQHGFSRTVPAVTEKYVVTIGPMCQVMCVDADSGSFKWGIDLQKEYSTKVPDWFTAQCPLIEDSLVIIAPAGSSLFIAVDCETGEVVWETPNPNNLNMSHSSIIPYEIHGKKMYVYCALGGIVGISAEGADVGEIMFETNLWNENVVMPCPVYLGDGRLFVTSGYGAGTMMFNIIKENNTYSVELLQDLEPGEGLASYQQTPIFYDGHLFSIMPLDSGPLKSKFVCFHPDDIVNPVWTSEKTVRFGKGPYLMADGKFYILNDDGMLSVMKVSTTESTLLTQSKILDGHDAWGPMALVNGRLLARDTHRLVCVDIRGAK
ncbi:PQQ-binding-like beta-propeller repeat protein [candidate division KSB1 bacterium]